MDVSAEELCAQIDRLWDCFFRLKAFVPYTEDTMVGAQVLEGAPYYAAGGRALELHFEPPLTPEHIAEINESGLWLNENYVVRLYAVLESHDAIRYGEPVDQELEGGEHVAILKKLRNRIAHDDGRFDPEDTRHQKLAEDLSELYNIEETDRESHFHLPIDKVLKPMTDGVKSYVHAVAT